MKRIVISQPMLFPWVGMLEQLRLADTFVHYDDVQFSKGSFTNRVQVKAADGIKWLTIPLRGLKLGMAIRDVPFDEATSWQQSHLGLLKNCYKAAPYYAEMVGLVETVYAQPAASVGDVAVNSMMALNEYFDLGDPERFVHSAELNVGGSSSERVVNIVRHLGGEVYITGHGAAKYLDHELFERLGIRVEYINYEKVPYPQLHGEFTPYVSALDLVANAGRAGRDVIRSQTLHWSEFLKLHAIPKPAGES